jgi:hypothetical protein
MRKAEAAKPTFKLSEKVVGRAGVAGPKIKERGIIKMMCAERLLFLRTCDRVPSFAH